MASTTYDVYIDGALVERGEPRVRPTIGEKIITKDRKTTATVIDVVHPLDGGRVELHTMSDGKSAKEKKGKDEPSTPSKTESTKAAPPKAGTGSPSTSQGGSPASKGSGSPS